MLNQAFCSKTVCHVPLSPLHHLFGKSNRCSFAKIMEKAVRLFEVVCILPRRVNFASSKSAVCQLQVRFVISPFLEKVLCPFRELLWN